MALLFGYCIVAPKYMNLTKLIIRARGLHETLFILIVAIEAYFREAVVYCTHYILSAYFDPQTKGVYMGVVVAYSKGLFATLEKSATFTRFLFNFKAILIRLLNQRSELGLLKYSIL